MADEVDGLRRALGDPSLGRIPPHLTLIPPLNVPSAQLPHVLSVLRVAAGAGRPFRLTLGPVATFAPANPVLYLSVGGDLQELDAVRKAVSTPPLQRPETWPWVPHVTVSQAADPERIPAAVAALDRYAALADVGRLVLLEEVQHLWRPVADADLGGVSVVGRGGIALELSRGRVLDPEARTLAGSAGAGWPPAGTRQTVVVTAHHGGGLAGFAAAWLDDRGGHVSVLVAPGARSQGTGGHLLAAVEAAVTTAGWDCDSLEALGPAGFYERRSARSRPVGYSKGTDE